MEGSAPILSPDEYSEFRAIVESQTPRTLKRFLDYGRRLRSGQGIEEMGQWVGRILLDDGRVYTLEDRARAFEIGVCEFLSQHWNELTITPQVVILCGPVDRTLIYRHLLQNHYEPQRRAALAQLLAQRYKKTWAFIGERAAESPESSQPLSSPQPLLAQFAECLDSLEPLEGAAESSQVQRLSEEVERQDSLLSRLGEQLEMARAGARQAQ